MIYVSSKMWYVLQAVREKRRNQSEDSDTDVIGPALPQKVMLSHKELGTQLLPGEGEMVYIQAQGYLYSISMRSAATQNTQFRDVYFNGRDTDHETTRPPHLFMTTTPHQTTPSPKTTTPSYCIYRKCAQCCVFHVFIGILQFVITTLFIPVDPLGLFLLSYTVLYDNQG